MRRALTLLAASAAVLAGCGGGDDGGGSGPAVTVPGDQPVEVSATEYDFEPASIVVEKPSGPVKIDLTNDGAVAHDLHVRDGGEDLGGTPIFGPGQTKSASVELDPGSYEIYCSVGDHEALGMKGTLEVE
jgi:plastocyanin